jgi:hypothetical protein
MKKIVFGLLMLVGAFPLAANAADSSNGCGLGWSVNSSTSFIGTSTRNTTNVTVPPTFGMTSGTSGCAKHSIAKKDEEAATFAVSNFEALKVEMAEGRGETLQGFARTLGCVDSAFSAFSTMSQKNYGSIVSESDANGIEFFRNVQGQIRKDPVLAVSCNAV